MGIRHNTYKNEINHKDFFRLSSQLFHGIAQKLETMYLHKFILCVNLPWYSISSHYETSCIKMRYPRNEKNLSTWYQVFQVLGCKGIHKSGQTFSFSIFSDFLWVAQKGLKSNLHSLKTCVEWMNEFLYFNMKIYRKFYWYSIQENQHDNSMANFFDK